MAAAEVRKAREAVVPRLSGREGWTNLNFNSEAHARRVHLLLARAIAYLPTYLRWTS